MKKGFLIAFSLFLFASGCKIKHDTGTEILAEVGSASLTVEEARNAIPRHIFMADSIMAFNEYRDEWIRRQIILQEANRLNFSQRSEVQAKIERLKEEYILQAVQDYIIADLEKTLEVTEQEARNYFQQNKDKFTLNERYVRYRHLVANSYAEAQNARQDLLGGIPWEDVAREYSLYPDLKIQESDRFWPISFAGGDIQQLNVYLNVIGITEISPIHKAGNEYHFVQLLEERPQGDHPDLEWLIEEIKEWLVLEKRKRAFNTYVKNLYLQGQANNEINIYNVFEHATKETSDTLSSNNISNEE